MTFSLRFGALVVLLTVSLPNLISSVENDVVLCESIVHKWAESSSNNTVSKDKLTLKDLLFFLHVPRTGGRTYFHCFLRKLYTIEQECPRSYDKLRFDPSKTKCHLMVTHDDYSLVSKLPKEQTSVVTILRDPIDRVFSAYEFSVEVAARFLVHPNLTSATKMSTRLRRKSHEVSTLDIWPWKYLVPWMREDLFARRDARKLREAAEISGTSDPYNMADIVMPLLTFIKDPISHDIVHNGATFQVAGLTNNSHLGEAHKVRSCVRQYPELGHFILEVAKRRLDNMLYVGLTEDHRKSAAMFANMVGAQVLSRMESSNDTVEEDANVFDFPPSPDSKTDGPEKIENSNISVAVSEFPSTEDTKAANENMTVDKLMEAYEKCINGLRKAQSTRRTISLKNIAPANFSKKARRLVPDKVLQQILTLNNLDVELYKHARHIFEQQQNHLKENTNYRWSYTAADSENERVMSGFLYGCFTLRFFLVAMAFILFVVLLHHVAATRGRTSKLKV